VGAGTTGEDGRVASLLSAELIPGWYQLVFDLAPYYGSQHHFFSRVTLDIAVAEARHHHVPLLVSPFHCSAYRGS
jgi:5-hydroxyisourate hydrolase